ncbi:hypothetical protein HID58_022374 [Brassica napus]|uniref:PPM-type phosphatase domain-containing protein n=2 Tax=Brassica TaxID=3705 RepID=A0ABQ8D1M3_BRANA|nr:hypothetical protein HID58_022374 [Brassica napus]
MDPSLIPLIYTSLLFFENAEWLSIVTIFFLQEPERSNRKTYRLFDLAIEDERVVSGSSGTTAFTAFLIGHHLVVVNACDCRAIICRKEEAVDMEREASDNITLAVKCFVPSAPTPQRRRIQLFVSDESRAWLR